MTAVVRTFRRGEWRTSLDTAALPGTGGASYGLALVPEIVAHADRRWWDTTRATLPPLAGRRELLLEAVGLFGRGTVTVGGVGAQDAVGFRAALWGTAGLPGPLVDRWCAMLREALLKRGGEPVPDDRLSLVALPGNTFTCLDSVLDQAERSGAVWVRPSRREPLSAARLVAALLAVGWPPARIGLYPAEHRTLHGLLKLADRRVVYGGAGLAASVRDAESLTLHGPGRGCALVPPGMPVEAAVDWLLPLVAADAGRFCSNVRTVVCTDPSQSHALASSLGAALDTIPPDPASRDRPLTVFREPAEAHRALRSVHERMRPGDRMLTRREPIVEVDGAPCVLPRLVRLQAPEGHPLVGHEVPFPFAAVLAAAPGTVRAITAESLFVHRPAKWGPA
ncbi:MULTISPECIES: hypothetical protein [Streptomyces]|uniref:hypothetical protein n=1 Tax=Streptomyces TaxID=1883 RepID=UPI001E49582E|nr:MULTISPECIES: hypothetical protein [Streptomyces]UFQ19260.1 hypothetical protein J2N69_32210 [Streptomyces huasconensis]WCL88879.1 hypothetical protein PPN52_32160 [Streptomyces sp. JCM 35825]